MNFVHLHVHTDYSLLDGACQIGELTKEVARLGMPAVAITDHGNLFGAVSFHDKAKAHGIKPIIGCEVYVAPGGHRNRDVNDKRSNHLTLLAENNEGYRNLIQLVSTGFLDGFYYKPRVDHELLAKHSKGLIVLSGCMSGEVAEAILAGNHDQARERAYRLRDIFGEGNFFLEVQDQGLQVQTSLNRSLVQLSHETNIPLVATNDCHYLTHADARAHEILLCIQTGTTMSDPKRMRFATDQFCVKSADEMFQVFRELPDALQRTIAIAERCSVSINRIANPYPQYPVPEGYTTDSYFEKIVRDGFASRAPTLERFAHENRLRHSIVDYERRLEDEIQVIKQKHFAGYFLIVWDYVRYARAHGIPVGDGRGSAAGSLVSYALRITDVDPLQYNLLFERFLNLERTSLPDIDTDFCARRREEVVDYVRKKYGEGNVAQIITFGTMGAKAVLKDVARALDMPYAEGARLAGAVPNQPRLTLEEALEDFPALASMCAKDERAKEVVGVALRLEGCARQTSIHPAGVVISPRPLTEIVPVHKSNKDEISTQYDMYGLEQLGLLKMDFLGLATLTMIHDALKLIEKHRGVKIDIENLPLDDAETYKLFVRGDTTGVFQFEADDIRSVLRRYQPARFEDLVALNALNRPGPMKGGMVEEFIARKHGKRNVTYEVAELREILAETFGVIVYQEQVMQIANRLAGYSLGDADILRHAMGKKKTEEMAAQCNKFLSGCQANGIPLNKAENIFSLMAKFAEYGFNKSHSCAYALVAYKTAWLKAHYPVEFMTAMLISETEKADEVAKYINEARRMGIGILPPDLYSSEWDFTPVGHQIRLGFSAIKKLGEGAAKAIIRARTSRGRFSNLADFCEAVDVRLVNKSALENLVKSGALDSLGTNRAQMIVALPSVLQRKRQGGRSGVQSSAQLPDVVESVAQRLSGEKEALEVYVSGHPLDEYRTRLARIKAHMASSLKELPDRSFVTLAGLLSEFTEARSKKGTQWARAVLEDYTGSAELLIFERSLEQFRSLLIPGHVLLVRGSVRLEGEAGAKAFVERVEELTTAQIGKPQVPRNAFSSQTPNENIPASEQDLCLKQ